MVSLICCAIWVVCLILIVVNCVVVDCWLVYGLGGFGCLLFGL